MSKTATRHCAICYRRSHDETIDHDFATVFDTRVTDDVFCPWCRAQASSDELESGSVLECDECEREFSVEIDYDPVYTTARFKCFACDVEMPKIGMYTNLGRYRACSERCRDAMNAAYQSGAAFPRRGFVNTEVGNRGEIPTE